MSTRKNTLFMALYEVLVYLAPLITAPYVARVLGTSGVGIYSYTFSIASYFVVAVQLGVSIYGRREIASKISSKERTKAFWTIFACIFLSFVICSFFFFISVAVSDNSIKPFLKWQYFILVAGWLDIGWFFFGIEQFKLAVSRNIFVKFISLVLIFLLIRSSGDTLKYIILMSVTNVISVLVMWLALPKYLVKTKISLKDIVLHLKPLGYLAIPIISIQLYSLTDKIFIGLMMDLPSVGIYENMYKLSRVPIALITTMGTVLLPRITNMIANGMEKETFRYIDKSLSLTLIVASACCFGLIGISPWLVPLYYGNEFKSGVPILQVLSIVLIIIGWGNVFRNQFIIPRKKDKIYIVSVVAAAILNIILNIIFIPMCGIIGAAVASILSELIACIYQCAKIKSNFDFKNLLKKNIPYIIVGILMCFSVYGFGFYLNQNSISSLILLIAFGSIFFLIVSCIFESFLKTKILQNELKNHLLKNSFFQKN